jgi:hypothetical protein
LAARRDSSSWGPPPSDDPSIASCTIRRGSIPVKASIPILILAGVAGVWLGLVLLVLRAMDIHVP